MVLFITKDDLDFTIAVESPGVCGTELGGVQSNSELFSLCNIGSTKKSIVNNYNFKMFQGRNN